MTVPARPLRSCELSLLVPAYHKDEPRARESTRRSIAAVWAFLPVEKYEVSGCGAESVSKNKMASTPKGVGLAVVFREARFEDYEDIAAVQSRNGLIAKPLAEWKYLWIGNPLYQQLTEWHLGWVAENEEGEIVGYVGHVPLSYEFRGRQIVAACAHGLSIDSSYRGYGVHLLKRHLGDKYTDVVLTSTANPNSGRLCDALCSRVPTGNWSETRFWITNHDGFAASALQSKGWPSWLSFPASTALALRNRLSKPTAFMRVQDANDLQVRLDFDETFDTFWEELKSAYPGRFMATRSRALLQWHFNYAMAKDKIWIVTAGESRICAYAIFYREDNPAIGLTRMRLVDFQALGSADEMLVPMVAWACRRCQEQGIHMLEAFGFRPETQQVIDSLKPYRRPLPFWQFFYRVRDKSLRSQLADPTVWDPSHYDADATL